MTDRSLPREGEGCMSSFQDLHTLMMQDPEFREAYEDAQALSTLRDALVKVRKVQGLNQTQVADRMGVGQPTISEFENTANDPRISTLQRYARAVSAMLELKVCLPVSTAWTKPTAERWEQQRSAKTTARGRTTTSLRGAGTQSLSAKAWRASRDSTRDDFALGA